MGKYLGETVVEVQNSKYSTYNREDWAMLWIKLYSGIDGGHHKDWLLDQVARILKGTKVIVKIAKWDDGVENTRLSLDEPTLEYHSWVTELKDGEDGPNTYDYSIGIAP